MKVFTEESPDSAEQHAGEQPGLVNTGTESATENNRFNLLE
jgi:hypothetical protein